MGRKLSVSRGRFRRYVRRAVEDLPARFRRTADNLLVVVEPSPQASDYEQPREEEEGGPLFGIYRGISLSERSAGYLLAAPDVIAVFRRPLLRYCRRRARLREEIRRTVVHEFGHYLGLDEAAVGHV
jgi:predicted Zn-dependent protease with MMP-like domain